MVEKSLSSLHIQTLLSLNVIHNPVELTVFYDKLVANVRALKSLDISPDNVGVILTPIIVSCLSHEIKDECSRESEDHETDLDYLIYLLEKDIRSKERCQTLSGLEGYKTASNVNSEGSKNRSRAHSNATALQASSVKSGRKCDLCGMNNRNSDHCFKYLKLDVKDKQN